MVVQYVAHTTTKSTVQQPTSVKWSMTWSVNKHLKILAALSDLSLFGPLLPDLTVAAARGNRLAQLTVNGRKMNERNCRTTYPSDPLLLSWFILVIGPLVNMGFDHWVAMSVCRRAQKIVSVG